jgi:tetratricopeptide (TPR) repeat protein
MAEVGEAASELSSRLVAMGPTATVRIARSGPHATKSFGLAGVVLVMTLALRMPSAPPVPPASALDGMTPPHDNVPVKKLLALAFGVALAFPIGQVNADVGDRLPRLAKLRAEVAAARGPEAYVALRKVWGEWDRGDPSEVEEVLHEVSADAGAAVPVREYASLLEAYARRRRGDLEGAKSRVAALGFVGKWMGLGPFDNDGKVGLTAALDPEKELELPLDVTRDYDGKDHKPVRWRLLPPVSPYGWTDVSVFVRPAEQSCEYLVTFVRDPKLKDAHATRVVSVWAGATGGMRVYWNGSEIIHDEHYRDLDSDRFAATATLRAGWNRVTAKVCGDERAPMLSLRVASASGAPDASIEVDADPRHSTRQGGAVVPLGKGVVERTGGVEGPAQAFERMSKGGDPAVLEAYAKFLGATGADDPTEHRARELARRAADKAPTIERLLLAGELAESRNQRADWITKAEALVARGGATHQQTLEVLLSRAAYARTGVNWRDAVPYYEKVLAMDPDDVPATLAKVELYEEAGLRDTALALLQSALQKRPRSVAFLRATVAALRDEGRETEAEEMAERYSAVRFDDPAFARARVDLAVARRDAPTAARWIERLLATNPDSAGALQTAAQTWMRLGERPRAIGAYRRALELAPEDTDVMRELATLYAVGGEREEELRLLKRVLELSPQSKDVRDQVAHIEPAKPRPDEQYARPASEFLAKRAAPAGGLARRSLVDLQVTTVFPNGLAARFHQVVYQPLTEAAAAEAREYGFVYETDSEAVQMRAARVYRKDGQIDEAIESGAGAMADDPSMAMYTSARSYYVHFPRLEPGDVVELQYRVEDVAPRNAFADYFGEIVYMQSAEPVARSEYVLITPKTRTLHFNEPRVPGLTRTVEEKGDERIFHFTALDVPEVKQEALQPPWTEVLGHVHVSTYTSWDEMGHWYWGLIKDQLVPDDEVKRRAEALTKGLKDDRAKVRAVYDYVVQETRYVALEFGIHGFKPYRAAQIFARGFGDCKDKATLIVTMLSALGIKATPVVVRTGNKGDIEAAPASLAPFDHMIAYVPSMDLYLDGTAEYTGSTELPAMDRGAIALQVNEGNAKLVRLPDPPASESVSVHKVDAVLGADGAAQLDWRAAVSGVEASEWRVRFHADATRKQRVQAMMASILPGSEVTAVDAGNFEDVEQKVGLHVHGKVPQFARAEGDGLMVPLGRKEHMVRDYASLASRKLDVRLYAQWTQEDDWTVKLPPGAKVTRAPQASTGSSPFGTFAVNVESSGSSLHVKTTVTMQRTRVGASEYPAFRAWCEQVDRALGQRATVSVK